MHNPLNHAWVVLGVERGSEVPGAVRERLRWPRVLIWLALAVTVAALVLVGIGAMSFRGWLWVLPALDLAVVFAGPRAINRRLANEVGAAHLNMCPNCGYQLTGLPETHVCPSCGAEFSLSAVHAVWSDWFRRTIKGWRPPGS